MDQVTDELNPAGGLGNVTESNVSSSQVIVLTVQHEDPLQACRIANTTAEIFTEEVTGIMNVDTVRIFAPARLHKS